jgi:glycosyltransferase involved in cell wall biosynthesis
MRIGLFTDTYYPAMNGIVNVVDITRRELEQAGHEVFIFCPGVRSDTITKYDDHVIRFPSVPSGLFEDNRISVFFPMGVMRKIRKLNLEVIHFFTPLQVGMMGVYAAQRTGAVLVGQHCTDFYQYVEHYPQVLPGLLLLGTTLPFAVKFNGEDVRTMLAMYRPHRGPTQWNQEIVEKSMALIYSRCDAVVALSRKSKKQLESWRGEYDYDVTLLPTGVDPLPCPTRQDTNMFYEDYGFTPDDEVFGYVGRLAEEKNLDLLIDAMKYIAPRRKRAKLLFVGDFNYRETLERLAQESGYGDRIIFTGRMPRSELGVVYDVIDVFAFPSMTDTQGLAIHEAALAGCPLVLLDKDLSEVFEPGVNGLLANGNGISIGRKVIEILKSKKKRAEYGTESKRLAGQLSEKKQVAKQVQLYEELLRQPRKSTPKPRKKLLPR